MLGGELVQGGNLQQAHGAAHLAGQDFDGAIHASLATGHQAVKVSAADQGELRTLGNRSDDVRAIHDAGIHSHVQILADFAGNLGQQLERHRSAIQLATTVVGQDDSVHAQVGQLLGIRQVLHTLDDQLARPHLADGLQVLELDGGIHCGVQQLADGAASAGQGGELQRRGGQEVPPPPGARDGVDDGTQGDLRRDGEAVTGIAQTVTCHRGIHGEQQSVEASLSCALHQAVGDFALLHHVQLEPVAAVRVGLLHVLNAGGT